MMKTETLPESNGLTNSAKGAPISIEQRVKELEARIAELERTAPDDRVSMVVFSGDLDKMIAAFIIATGAAAMGQQVSMFFTFWGLNALRERKAFGGKSFAQKAMTLMSPGSADSLGVSKMNFFGVGAHMLKLMMRQKNVTSLDELMEMARELGVRIVACEMSKDVMGIGDDEISEACELGGVAAFLGDALKSRTTLFI